MGDYCTMRMRAPLNIAGSVIVGRLCGGTRWEEILVDFPFFRIHPAWMQDRRHNYIPHGGLQHVPQGWSDEYECRVDDESIWHLQCSVKTTSTVELFVEHILPFLIREPVEVEYEHEHPADEGTIEVEPAHHTRSGRLHGSLSLFDVILPFSKKPARLSREAKDAIRGVKFEPLVQLDYEVLEERILGSLGIPKEFLEDPKEIRHIYGGTPRSGGEE